MKNAFRLKLGLLLSSFFLFLTGAYGADGPVLRGLKEVGAGITSLLENADVVFALMFIATFMGTFSMFQSLLKLAFKSHSGFTRKPITVISMMLSVIGTLGIFFMYRSHPDTFIYIFGGGVGYFLILFFVVFVMKFMYNFAESSKDETGIFGKGPMWVFLVVLGVLVSSYLMIGYTGTVLGGLNCHSIPDPDAWVDSISCNSQQGTWLYAKVYNFFAYLIPYVIVIAIGFGIWGIIKKMKKNKEEKEEESDYTKEDEESDNNISQIKSYVKNFVNSLKEANEAADDKVKILKDMQKIINGGGN